MLRYSHSIPEIWTYMERDSSGHLLGTDLELLTLGKTLSKAMGGQLVAPVFGNDAAKAAMEAGERGADTTIVLESSALGLSCLEPYAEALSCLVTERMPAVVLIGATAFGRDLAPAVASRTGGALFTDCEDVAWNSDRQQVIWTRSSFSGSILAETVCIRQCLQIGTVRPQMFPRAKREISSNGFLFLRAKEEDFLTKTTVRSSTLLEVLEGKLDSSAHIEEADVVIAGGRGAGGEKGFHLIRELADILGGAVGASRVAVDKGWIDRSHLIGQSGKTIRPKLYIACGIAGSIQHITGMRDADFIISINTDPKALIFDVSDYAVVGDMFLILPFLIKELQKRRDFT